MDSAAPGLLANYQIIRRNGAVVPFAPDKIAIAMMKAHGVTRLVIHKDLMSRDSLNYLVTAFRRDGDSVVFNGAGSTVFSLIR